MPGRTTELSEMLADYHRASEIVEGLERLVPTEGDTGVGARFDALLRLGPKTVAATIVLRENDPGRRVRWAELHGERAITFDLRQLDEETAAVRISVSYEAPSGLASVIGRVVEETVRAKARGTLDRLRQLSAGRASGDSL